MKRVKIHRKYLMHLLTIFSLTVLIIFTSSLCFGATIFTSGWENAGSAGCGSQLLDGSKWSDIQPGVCSYNCSPCWSGASLSITNNPIQVHSGSYAMLQTAPDCSSSCGGINGPGAGIEYNFSSVSNFYMRFYLKQSPGWRSRPNDTLANWVIWQVVGDCWWCLSNDNVNCGAYDFSDRWHYVELHTHQGTNPNGHIQVRIDGVQKYLIWPGYGNSCNAGAKTIPAISHVKFDLVQGGGGEQKLLLFGPGTHEFYFFVKNSPWYVSNQDNFSSLVSGHQWRAIDDVEINNGDGWIGPLGSTPPSPPSPAMEPSAPTGLRIVQ